MNIIIDQSHFLKPATTRHNPLRVELSDLSGLIPRTRGRHPGRLHEPQANSTKTHLMLVVTLIVLAVTTGCDRALVLKTPLESSETVAKGDTVLVDGLAAGLVKNVVTEGGQRLAVLTINDEAGARQKMRAGVVRVIQDGHIDLRTDGVATDSAQLLSGSLIPTTSKTAFLVGKIANKQIAFVILLAVVGVVLLVILFRSARGTVVVLLALLLAVATGWVLHPYAVPWVEKVYQSTPKTVNTPATGTVQTPGQNSPSDGIVGLERRAVKVLSHRPDARLVAFVAISGAGFLIFALLISRALSSVKRTSC